MNENENIQMKKIEKAFEVYGEDLMDFMKNGVREIYSQEASCEMVHPPVCACSYCNGWWSENEIKKIKKEKLEKHAKELYKVLEEKEDESE